MESVRKTSKASPAKRHFFAAKRGPIDWRVLVLTLLLSIVGIMMCFSSSSYTAAVHGNPYSELLSQLRGLAVGLVLLFLLAQIDYHFYRQRWIVFSVLGLSWFLLAVLLVLPEKGAFITAPIINNARRWLKIKSFSLQPSEIAKFAVILYLAARLSGQVKKADSFWYTLVPCCAVAGVAFLLVMIGPDLSTGACILFVTLCMLYYGGAKKRYIFLLIACGLILAALYIGMSPMRQERFLAFCDPENYKGEAAYQLKQSLYALGNGGLLGTGLGQSRQKLLFLPYAYSDFIFAIVSEELGFILASLILICFLLLIFFGLRVAVNCEDRFGTLLCAGIISLIGVQVVLNVAVVTGIIPTTGIPLPFFTSGGTSLSIFLGSIGVVLSVSRYKRKLPET